MEDTFTIGDRLAEERAHVFVGRAQEIRQFDTLLAPDCQQPIWFLVGAGGLGKSTLMQVCRRRAIGSGISTIFLDTSDSVIATLVQRYTRGERPGAKAGAGCVRGGARTQCRPAGLHDRCR